MMRHRFACRNQFYYTYKDGKKQEMLHFFLYFFKNISKSRNRLSYPEKAAAFGGSCPLFTLSVPGDRQGEPEDRPLVDHTMHPVFRLVHFQNILNDRKTDSGPHRSDAVNTVHFIVAVPYQRHFLRRGPRYKAAGRARSPPRDPLPRSVPCPPPPSGGPGSACPDPSG